MKHPLSRNVLMTPGPVEEPLDATATPLAAEPIMVSINEYPFFSSVCISGSASIRSVRFPEDALGAAAPFQDP